MLFVKQKHIEFIVSLDEVRDAETVTMTEIYECESEKQRKHSMFHERLNAPVPERYRRNEPIIVKTI
jgi:hypothetical protein